MADVKISALPAATTPLAGTEVLPIVQSSTTKQVAVADLTAGRAMSATSLTLTTPLGVASGGTGLTSLTAGYIPFASSSSALSFSSNIYSTGSNVGIGTSSPSNKLVVSNAGAEGLEFAVAADGANINTFISYNRSTSAFNKLNVRFNGLSLFNGATEAFTLDTAGNLGLGVTPSAWAGSAASIQLPQYGAISAKGSDIWFGTNFYYNFGFKYSVNGPATRYENASGQHIWYYAASGTAGNAISFTQAMTLDASGNLGVGTTSPTVTLQTAGGFAVQGPSGYPTSGGGWEMYVADTANVYLQAYNRTSSSYAYTANYNAYAHQFKSQGGNAVLIDSSGNLLVGTTSASESGRLRVLNTNNTEWNNLTASFEAANGTRALAIYNGAAGFSTAATCVQMGKNTATSRSLNASGTLNASGADYAEYMEKAGDFTIAKGDICGIDADGKITNIFADAVTFVVKSTNPSYVGGDTWGVGFEKDDPSLEIARQKVDRIAFAGQVPVNVIGASAGDYIIPENDNGSIKGIAVSNPTLEQYRIAVGRVIATEADGRARIIVKVA